MVLVGGMDLLGILDLAGQLGRGMDQSGEALRTQVDLLTLVLQGHQRDLLFGLIAIQASFHYSSQLYG